MLNVYYIKINYKKKSSKKKKNVYGKLL